MKNFVYLLILVIAGYIVAPSIMMMIDNPTEITFIDEEGNNDYQTEFDKKTKFIEESAFGNYSEISVETNSTSLISFQVAISFIPDPISPPPRV